MAENRLFPAYLLIEYHSAFAPHVMTLPTREAVDFIGDPATFTLRAWDGTERDVNDMVLDLFTQVGPRFASTSVFDRWSLFTLDTPTSEPFFRGSNVIAITGSAATPGWAKATQETIIMRDTEGELSKLVLMDFASGNNFERFQDPAPIGLTAIVTQLTLASNAWSSRNGAKPATFVARTATLNEKLRRNYHLA